MRNMFKPSDAFFQRTFIKMYKDDESNKMDIYFHWNPKNGKFVIRKARKDKYSIFQRFRIPTIKLFTDNAHLKAKNIYIISEINPFDFEPDVFANIKNVMNDFTLYIMPNFKKIVKSKSYPKSALISYISSECSKISANGSYRIRSEVKNDILHVFLEPYKVDKPKFEPPLEKKPPKKKKKKEGAYDRFKRMRDEDREMRERGNNLPDGVRQVDYEPLEHDPMEMDGIERGADWTEARRAPRNNRRIRIERHMDRNGHPYFEEVFDDGQTRRFRRFRRQMTRDINGNDIAVELPVDEADINDDFDFDDEYGDDGMDYHGGYEDEDFNENWGDPQRELPRDYNA